MLRFSSGLSDAEELLILAICLVPSLLLLLIYWLIVTRRLRKFYLENQYRVFGEVLSARQVTAAEDAACWELTVRFENAQGEEETVRLSTYDAALAQARSVELAVIPDTAMPQERALDKVTSYTARELRYQDPKERQQLAQALLDEQQGNGSRRHPGFGAERVRFWEERIVTSEQRLRRKRLRRKLITALVMIGLSVAGMVVLVLLAGNV